MFSYFVWNGINSRDMGIYLDAPAPVMRGKERTVDVKVLGRAGTLTLTEGEDIYEPYTQQLILRAREDAHPVSKWLRGEGWVTFSPEPERKQRARVINQTSFKRVSRHLNWYEGTVQFYCQPLKRAVHEAEYAIISTASVTNLGDVTERPVITLTGAYGDITLGFKNGDVIEPLYINGLDESYGGCVVDGEARQLLSLDGQTLLTNLTSGAFPFIEPGVAQFRMMGSTTGTATIGRRQKWL